MAALHLLSLAQHLSRVRRAGAAAQPGVVMRALEGPSQGWITGTPGVDPGEFPSTSMNRIWWMCPPGPITRREIDEALAAARAMDCRRMYIWLAPWGRSAEVDAALAEVGATRQPYVEYVALVRDAAAVLPELRASTMRTRAVEEGEVRGLLDAVKVWYSETGAARAAELVRAGEAELHIAFEGDKPVAIGLFSAGAEHGRVFGHLSSAGTDPAYRGRGAQTALIHARVRRAAELGCTWCTCETNTTVPISLRNLERAGFAVVIRWCVYRWDDAGAND